MRRITSLAFLLVVLVGLLAIGRATGIGAQNATPALGTSGHPLVGAWVLDSDASDPTNPPTLAFFSADGIYADFEPDGASGLGVWASTGPSTADLTFHWTIPAEAGGGLATVRAAITVAADGQSFTASYTLELVAPDGTATGQYGPTTATGTRIAAEPMGTPVGTIGDLFARFEETGATPEASPAA